MLSREGIGRIYKDIALLIPYYPDKRAMALLWDLRADEASYVSLDIKHGFGVNVSKESMVCSNNRWYSITSTPIHFTNFDSVFVDVDHIDKTRLICHRHLHFAEETQLRIDDKIIQDFISNIEMYLL